MEQAAVRMVAGVPTNVSIADARLPAAYEAAVTALANCASIDECKDWADKAAAMASYAKQADDDSLFKYATRVKSRAVRRCGELLKTFDARPENAKQSSDEGTLFSQREAAAGAGLSKRQQVQAVRVANVPAEEFESLVESDMPPTVTALAEMGTRSRDPDAFARATHALGELRDFAKFCADHEPEYVAQGVMPREAGKAREHVAAIDAWLDRFVVNLPADGDTP